MKKLFIVMVTLSTAAAGAEHRSGLGPLVNHGALPRAATPKTNAAPAALRTDAASRNAPKGVAANPAALSARIQPLLPAGTSLPAAASGFGTEGRFLAAVHVSQNLRIPFTQLKAEAVSGKSLGQAIENLKPGLTPADVRADLRIAARQAKHDLSDGDEVELASGG